MNPNLFLENGRETIGLVGAVAKIATVESTAKERRAVINNAGVELPSLQLATDPVNFAQQIVAEFKRFCVSESRIDYHPMLRLLEYMRTTDTRFHLYNFDDEEFDLFDHLIDKGQENLRALDARRSVGRIEDVTGSCIGTGILIKNNLLLTCDHIISKSGVTRAWVRFGYKLRCDGITTAEGQKFELDLMSIVAKNSRQDFTVLRIQEAVKLPVGSIVPAPISSNEAVRLIHHPEGKPIEISEWGAVRQVGEDYIDHDVPTSEGSSGAPILNKNWEVVAIHRGNPGVGRTVTPGTTEGLPVRTIWGNIRSCG